MTAAAAAGQRLIEDDAPDGSLLVHRPERSFPVLPAARPVVLPRPPQPPGETTGMGWAIITPIVGSLSLVAFAFIIRNPIYLVVAFVVVIGMTVAVVGNRVASNRRQQRQWKRQRTLWLARAAKAEQEAVLAARQQRDALAGMYPAPAQLRECAPAGSVWERRPQHPDFLTVRLGTGRLPALAPISSETEDGGAGDPALEEYADRLVRTHASLADTPVTIDLARLSSVGIVGSRPRTGTDLVNAALAQLLAGCAPSDLRVIGLVTPEHVPDYDWLKWVPHTRDISSGEGFARSQRAVTTSVADFHDQLRLAMSERQPVAGDDERSAAARLAVLPHLVVLLDEFHPLSEVAQSRLLRTLLRSGSSLRVTVLLTTTAPEGLPHDCSATLQQQADGTWIHVEAGPGGRVISGVAGDPWDTEAGLELARWLAPRRPGTESAGRRDNTIRLSEMLGVDLMSQLGAQPSWRQQRGLYDGFDPDDLLVAPIGITDDGAQLRLNLREAATDGDGPHGVMVGATGSGKSELLRTIVAGLVATHPPDLLNVLAIDFKGGTAFTGLEDLPHLVGLITNLEEDPALIDRMQLSLDGEVQRRQALLVAAGADNIGQYRARPGADLAALPYLFLVIDEFSELLATKPEFIVSLAAIGRLGRALGIHMLLATQRLDEGRLRGLDANLRYRIALRTFTSQDSNQILGSTMAYELPPLPGLGYLKVDSGTTRFKAALATVAQRSPDRARTPDQAASVRTFTLEPAVVETEDGPVATGQEQSTELEVLREMILAQPVVTPRPVWLNPLPARLTLHDLWSAHEADGLRIGLVDRPAQQAQTPLTLTTRSGHLAVIGAPQAGKSTALRSLTLAAVAGCSPDQVQVYGIDSGGGLGPLSALPHTGAIAGRHQPEAIRRLLSDLTAVVTERAAACREAGVDTIEQLRALPDADDFLPNPLRADVWVLIDNIGILRSDLPDEEIQIGALAATCLPLGIRLAISASRWLDIRPSLLDAISTRIELRLNDPNDSLLSRPAAKLLPDLPGRGLVAGGFQVQLALPSLSEGGLHHEAASFESVADRSAAEHPGVRAPSIAPVPDRVTEAMLPSLAAAAGRQQAAPADDDFVLAVHEHRLTPVVVDLLRPGGHLLVYGDQRTGKTTVLTRSVRHLLAHTTPAQVQLHVVDLNRGLIDQADDEHVASYCFTLSQARDLAQRLLAICQERLPPPTLTRRELEERSWWSGPEHVLVVDDYQLLLRGADGPLSPLADALSHAHDVGLHVLASRTIAGSARSMYEAFGKRLQEMAPTLVVLPGDSNEGPVAAGISARKGPPGRAQVLLPGGVPAVAQLLDLPEERP